MASRENEPSPLDNHEGPDHSSPGEGFELYRHKNADKMRTKGWHGTGPVLPSGVTTRYVVYPPRLGSTQGQGASSLGRASKNTTRR